MANSEGQRSISWGELFGLALLVAVVALLAWSGRSASNDAHINRPLPEFMVEGWLNSDSLSPEDLQGKFVVIDCWATWCPPCRASMPELADLYAKYRPLGVEFVGLTPESKQELPTIKRFLQSVPGTDWPIGYGAIPTLDMLGIEAFPTLILFNRKGISVWAGHHPYELVNALDVHLAGSE